MKQLINKNLITLKCVLFCFLSGIGCIFPFLPLHMLSIGLDRGEARLISVVAPCIALLGPAILGPLIDKLSVGRGSTGGGAGPSGSGKLLRVVTAICLILSALFYTLLLAVPYTERHEARRPQVLFMCDADGGYVMQEVCTQGMRCNRWEGEKSGVLAVSSCEYGCADENMTWVTSPFSIPTTTTTLSPMYNSVANSIMISIGAYFWPSVYFTVLRQLNVERPPGKIVTDMLICEKIYDWGNVFVYNVAEPKTIIKIIFFGLSVC